MLPIIISGGSYPDNWKSVQDANKENFIRFDKAEMFVVDWDRLQMIREIEYQSPPESRNPSMMFKVADLSQDRIISVTNSEIVEYDRQTYQIKKVISHPSFNDLHSVKKIDGRYYLVNTGLEILQIVAETGEIIGEHNLAAKPTWEKFSTDIDYRKVGSTKPHEIHANNLFDVQGEIFVTRLMQKDAINIDDPDDKYDVGVGSPHDGVVFENNVYFTTTNGHLVIFDAISRKRKNIIDINSWLQQSGLRPGGWCRGVLPLSENRVLVGYTQLRHTKFKEFISWAKNLGEIPEPTRVIELDLAAKKIVKSFTIPGRQGSAIFSILKL